MTVDPKINVQQWKALFETLHTQAAFKEPLEKRMDDINKTISGLAQSTFEAFDPSIYHRVQELQKFGKKLNSRPKISEEDKKEFLNQIDMIYNTFKITSRHRMPVSAEKSVAKEVSLKTDETQKLVLDIPKRDQFLKGLNDSQTKIIQNFEKELMAFVAIGIKDVIEEIISNLGEDELELIDLYLKAILPGDLLKQLTPKEKASLPKEVVNLINAYEINNKFLSAKLLPEKDRLIREMHIPAEAMKSWEHKSIIDQVYGLRVYEIMGLMNYDFLKISPSDALSELHLKIFYLHFHTLPPLELILEKRDDIEKIFNEQLQLELKHFQSIYTYIFSYAPEFRGGDKPKDQLSKEPKFLSKFKNLTHLTILSRSWPAEYDFSKFRELETLEIGECNLINPPDCQQLKKLRVLKLKNNQIVKAPDLTKNPDVTFVDLSGNPDLSEVPKFNENLSCRYLHLDVRRTSINRLQAILELNKTHSNVQFDVLGQPY